MATYLLKQDPSVVILARNVRYKHGEIDIVYESCLDSGSKELVFVEVKASLAHLDQALWNFTLAKQFKFKRAVQTYLASYNGDAITMRLVLAIVCQEKIRILDWTH